MRLVPPSPLLQILGCEREVDVNQIAPEARS
jgi:hypothetical protein